VGLPWLWLVMFCLGGPLVIFCELKVQRVSHVWRRLPLAILLFISEITYVLKD
jgi:hypothetical protein